MKGKPNVTFQKLKILLENLTPPTTNVIIHDRRFMTGAAVDEIEALHTAIKDGPIVLFNVPVEWLRKLYIFVPPDQLTRYRNGFPIVIRGVEREDVAIRQKHDRHDGDLVKAAKHALEMETFRLTGRQTAVESARNSRLRTLTASEAERRARQTIGVAAHRGSARAKPNAVVPTFDFIMGLVEGLIDRGRRLAKAFFNISSAADLIAREKAGVGIRIREYGPGVLEHIEGDNVDRVQGMAWNRERASRVSKAMEHWAERTASSQPITILSGERLTNASAERMTASALMKIAIAGDSEIHPNLVIEQDRFELGRVIGQLSRGRPIEIDAYHAMMLRFALIKRGLGCLETQFDTMNFLLAEAALTCRDMASWMKTLDRIASTGVGENIQPQAR